MSPAENQALDTSRCPLCGQSNQCAIVAGLPAQSCWCMNEPISRAALDSISDELRGKACICPHCARPVDSDLPATP